MNTHIVYVDTQSDSYSSSDKHRSMIMSHGVVENVYSKLRVEDGEEEIAEMLNTINVWLKSHRRRSTSDDTIMDNVLIIGTLTSNHCIKLDKLLTKYKGWSFISTMATSTRMKSLHNGFSVNYNDIHTISSLILLTESMYPQVLILADDMFGVDLYHAYNNSISTQTVKLQVMNERSPSLSKIEPYINSPKTIIISTLLGSKFDEVLDIMTHSRLISLNPWRMDGESKRHLVLIPSTPFPEKFGHCGRSGMAHDVMEFVTRIKKIEGHYNLGKSGFVELWNQFATDMKSSLSFFRNCTIDPIINIPRIYGARLVSNKRIIEGVEEELFNSDNCESFSQSIVSIYVKRPSRTQIEYWNSIEITPTELIIVRDEETDDVLYQRFHDSITDIGDDKLLMPKVSSWTLEIELGEEGVRSVSHVSEVDIFTLQPLTHTQYVHIPIIDRHSIDAILASDDGLDDDVFDDNLDDDYVVEPNLDFYHSIIA